MSFDPSYRRPPARPSALPVLVALLVGLAVGSAALWWLNRGPGAPLTDPNAQPREVAPRTGFDADEAEAIALFKAVRDSVVNVDTVRFVRRGLDSRVEAQQTGTGSGFMWDADGRIVTNFHVVREAVTRGLSVRVVLSDRTAYTGTVVGAAPDYDLAVVQIDAPKDKIKPIKVGTSKDLEVGQKAFAVGNPFGLSLTLTKGIVSALDREIESLTDRTISGAIQTDAPINPGNSGGPLFDKDGRLIGVNTSIASPSGGNVGIGFAIPVDTVNWVVPELIRNRRVLRPTLGVNLVDEQRLRQAGYPKGVMVRDVLPNSPAAAAGLRGVRANPQSGEPEPGDLIVAVNGEATDNVVGFRNALGKFKPGDTVTLTVERDEKRQEVKATLSGQ
jgi:S1-C subfamily serine protease